MTITYLVAEDITQQDNRDIIEAITNSIPLRLGCCRGGILIEFISTVYNYR